MKRLNWRGFTIILLLTFLGATANENISSFKEWFGLVLVIGFPASVGMLFFCKED